MDLSRRRHGVELMDDPAVPSDVMERTSRELDVINGRLGGFTGSLELLSARIASCESPVRLLDVGAGGGGTARFLSAWGRSRGIRLSVTALDLHAAACRVCARSSRGDPGVGVVRGDALRLPFADGAFHFVHGSLFLHHFPEEKIAEVLREMRRVSSEGVVVNDLERHPVAFHAIRILTRIFSRSRLVRHDAPVSVASGFREGDLERWREPLGSALGYRRRWPFRILAWSFADGGSPEAAA